MLKELFCCVEINVEIFIFLWYNESEIKNISERVTNMCAAKESNRKYKDSVFTRLFGEKDKLAELYNAISGTNYAPDDITLTTLENIIFIGRENDISFTIGDKLIVLIEHQSSINRATA